MAMSIVMEKVTVMARITIVTAIPKEILRFMVCFLRSEQQHHKDAAQQREYKHPCQNQTADAQHALAFLFVHRSTRLLALLVS
ncbi:hypothetical protein FAEPRAM212_00713 [Faecalibacterium prausnitzii M21/2]|uniref:Uncharacterized protein n=1 Tax=Faecalibacterium prausnitzii M21/2 TaxID=411485 RepID=A8S8C6_9FIRM|nr:hypothetical protein FAEPRAM212_00713 [Faecalibacterium prausnitzii M21/2]